MSSNKISVVELTKQLRPLLDALASFNASYEIAEEKLAARETKIEDTLVAAEQLLGHQLALLKNLFNEYAESISETGATRWRMAASQVSQDSENQLQQLKETAQQLNKILQENCHLLEQKTTDAMINLTSSVNNLDLAQIQVATDQGCQGIKIVTAASINQINESLRWIHWKNVALSFIVMIMVVLFAGLYINDEWPWEIHEEVINERNAGKTLLAAWPHLSAEQRQTILKSAKQSQVPDTL